MPGPGMNHGMARACVAIVFIVLWGAWQPVAAAEVSCHCDLDKKGRLDVTAACPGVDWKDTRQTQIAVGGIARCVQTHPIVALYFPAGLYRLAPCACGSEGIRTLEGGQALSISGDGIDKTIIENAAVLTDPLCAKGPSGPVFRFGAGTAGAVRDMTFLSKIGPRQANVAGAIEHGAELVRNGKSTVGTLHVDRVKMDNLGNGVQAQSHTTGEPTASEIYVTDSRFSNFRHSVFSQQGDFTQPDKPRTVFRITRSHFDHIGSICGRGYPFYIHLPFREVTIENSEFINLHHLGVSIFGGLSQNGSTSSRVTIRGNKFLQPLADLDPMGVVPCACAPGIDTDCPKKSDATVTNADLYGHTTIIFDGTTVPYQALVENNVFQSASAIVTQSPVVVRNNIFLGSRTRHWSAAVVGDEHNPTPGSVFKDNQFETSIIVPQVSADFVFSGNGCVRNPKTRRCIDSQALPMTLKVDSDRALISANTFPTGGRIEINGHDARVEHNTLSSRAGDETPLVTVSGDRARITDNTLMSSGKRQIVVAEKATGALVKGNKLARPSVPKVQPPRGPGFARGAPRVGTTPPKPQ